MLLMLSTVTGGAVPSALLQALRSFPCSWSPPETLLEESSWAKARPGTLTQTSCRPTPQGSAASVCMGSTAVHLAYELQCLPLVLQV